MYILRCLCIWSFMFGVQNIKSEDNVMAHPNWKLLDKETCGTSNSVRIIGGKNASIGAYPWIVQLGYTIDSKRKLYYRCGGTLINKIYVVTAAHCVADLPSKFELKSVRIGEHNTKTNPDCLKDYCAEPVQDIEPEEIIVHEEYNQTSMKEDIAIIRLKKPVILNENVKPICMPRDELLTKSFIGEIAEVAGWGTFDINDPKSSVILQVVKLPIVNLENCVKPFSHVTISQGQLCVGGKKGQDSCGGDSGGPLMKVEAVDGPPKYYLIGIVSFGAQLCGKSAVPAVYTQISHYLTWILNHLKP